MAFFKFRSNHQDELNASSAQGQSMEVLRKRVRHRLIGSAILVLIAVIGFPLIFDTQPRPVSLDVGIDIPDKSKVGAQTPPSPLKGESVGKSIITDDTMAKEAALKETQKKEELGLVKNESQNEAASGKVLIPNVPVPVSPSASAVSKESMPTPKTAGKGASNASVHEASGLDAREEIVASSASKVQDHNRSNASTASSAVVPAVAGSETKKEKESVDKDKKEASKAKAESGSARVVVQVGAFSEDQKVREVREKLEKANLHTFTQVVMQKETKKIRVRIGPFATKEEAKSTLNKVHALGFNPTLVTLP